MSTYLHHINLSSDRARDMDTFYREVVGLDPLEELRQLRVGGIIPETEEGAFLHDGKIQFHLAVRDLGVPFRAQQVVNPVDRGHIAFRTDDIEAVKQRLRQRGVPFSDYGVFAMKGWHQVFCLDPAGYVVEVHEVVE